VATPQQVRRRGRRLLVLGTMIAAAFPTTFAAADDISNNLDVSVDAVAEAMPLVEGGANGTTQLYVLPRNGDGKNGCNLTGGKTLVVSVASSDEGVATVSPTSITFASCGDTPTLTVTPHGQGSSTVSLSQVSNNTGAGFDLAPATFAVEVGPPPNTPPHASVTGVSGGASFPKGSVPAAACSITDAEDGDLSFPATLGPVSGPYAADGIGQQEASCSYTDLGGLTATASETYSIYDPTAPSIGYVRDPEVPDGLNGWYRGDVLLTWSVTEPEAPSSLAVTGCESQSVTADQDATDYSCAAESAGGSTGPVIVSIKRDANAPGVDCGTLPSGWQPDNVILDCTASDVGPSGLADTADAGFQLMTSVAAGGEEAGASSGFSSVSDTAGNVTTVGPYILMVDRRAPSISCDPAPAGWQASNVSVRCTAEDGGSGLADSADEVFYLSTSVEPDVETDSAWTNSREVCDGVGHCAVAVPISGIKIDRRAPEVSCDAADGVWHGSDVSIFCMAEDGGAGLADSADGFFYLSTSVEPGTETDTASTDSREVADTVGNSSHAGPIDGNKVDKKAPTLADAGPTVDPNAAGWYRTPVENEFNASDGGAGLAPPCVMSFSRSSGVGEEGRNVTIASGPCSDDVANTNPGVESAAFKIDLHQPNAPTPSADRAPDYAGDGGWYRDAVTVSFGDNGDPDLADGTPGSGVSWVSASETYATTGTFTAVGTAQDEAGNQSAPASMTVKVDAAAPTIVLDCSSLPATIYKGDAVTLPWSSGDVGSGLASPSSGSIALDTSSVGSRSAQVAAAVAEDNVGHASLASNSCSYSVVYNFHGFFAPIDNSGVFNVAKGGSAIPVKFDLNGHEGLSVFALGYPKATTVACPSSTPVDVIEETVTATTSGLKYDPTANLPYGQYIYVWKTSSLWAGTCRKLTVKLVDETEHSAYFKFKQ
jgi:hypothetical protein